MSIEQAAAIERSSTGPGRPRDDRIDERVLETTRSSLVERGWEGTSLRGVAERSGVSRPAIARRWPSKAHLVLAALLGDAPDLAAFEGVDLAGWIDGVIEGSFDLFDRPEVRAAAPGLIAALRDHDDVREALWSGFSGPASELALRLQHRPERTPDLVVDAQAAIVMAAGAALFLSLVVGDDAIRDRVAVALATSMTDILDLEP